MGASLLWAGDFARSRDHFKQGIALYDAAEDRPLAMRFGHDVGVVMLSMMIFPDWLLGHPEAALAGVGQALKNARESRHALTSIFARWYGH